MVRDRYGSADGLELRDVEVPRAGDDEVLVRVRAAGLDRGVWHVMAGLPYLIRLAGYGVRSPNAAGLGSEVAGVVEAVGANVTGLRSGDAVFGTCRGSFAEYALARPDRLASMPANLTFEQAAAVPVSAVTALQAVRDHGRVQAGQRALVVGASGGVGTFAVQRTLVIVGGEGGGRWTGGIHRQFGAMVLSPFLRQRLGTFIAKESSADLDALRALIESGSVTPVIDRVVALHEVPGAIRDLVAGQVRGKLVVAT
jgi:NADPH:quinone reductase-like Zn-dependent oxidoreductase